MFLLSSLCNKYVAMNTSFQVSLLYLLLLIPQHGNSPLPLMESWLQKDQDDGFVQRDMTSSLTGGDESFGSAHQTYQNSLIRKKKSENQGDDIVGSDFRKFASKYEQNHNQLFPQTSEIFDGRYVNQDYSAPAADNPRPNGIYEEFDRGSELSDNKFRSRPSNVRSPNREFFLSRFKDPFVDKLPLRGSILSLHKTKEPTFNVLDDNTNWGTCKRVQDSYSQNSLFALPPSVDGGLNFGENLPLENAYTGVEEDNRNRQMANQDYRDENEAEDRNPQFLNDNEYYETGENSMAVDDNINAVDYNQLTNDHAYVRKREEVKQAKPNNSPLEDVSNRQGTGIKTREVETSPESDLFWTLNPDAQSEELNEVVKNSQKALQEVKSLKDRMPYRQGETESRGSQRETRAQQSLRKFESSLSFDEKRLKREDEDEQKNMKTGTDEGGGGEYEDEEGKGHKDEEEYYEDADLSDDESGKEIRARDKFNQKYMKREVVQDVNSKTSKNEQNENNSEDYELNLENAPMENSGKSKKSYREDLATDYVNYVKVDLQNELHDVQDTIDDMLTRLDEFENLVAMVKTDSELCADISIPVILHSKKKLDHLCDQIDALEKLVSRAKSDVELIEMQVEEAEEVLGQPSGKLKNIFKPLFFKKPPNEVPTRRHNKTPTTYEAPTLFTTSSFFPSQNKDDVSHKDNFS